MKYNYYYKADKEGFPIPGFLVKRKHKPTGNWVKIVNPNVCCVEESCIVPVQFSCLNNGLNFYIEFLDTDDNIANGAVYSNNGDEEFEAQIPRGVFNVYATGLGAFQPLYFNGVLVGTSDGTGTVSLNGYDTTEITTISQCL